MFDCATPGTIYADPWLYLRTTFINVVHAASDGDLSPDYLRWFPNWSFFPMTPSFLTSISGGVAFLARV